ncbi:YheC/YheD family protein [Paenibacillus methanolicus]|uniref:YheC/D-like protein n=1 Tax=Paenibacillus methanolicus TaxID=582686 RepID=A0A5S5CHD0_9BACL|nr:YheC/YheD family protein [Paenibacillus methanolicus]TYP79199.1 YheC/D-like protein [Paenibacillus methanolicus]
MKDGSYIGSKWKKTAVIRKDMRLAPFIPETVRMSEHSLRSMLDHYGMVYVKPEYGTYGNGVMRAERSPYGYMYQVGEKASEHDSLKSLYQSILKDAGGKKYLVQRGIHLLRHKGKRFDLRVMAQLSPQGRWETTGVIGRVAAEGKIVTNYHSGGELVPAELLLAPYTGRVRDKLAQLEGLGAIAGHAMQRKYPGVYKIGLDIAMESNLKPWILEVNTRPDPYIFRKHPNPKIFRKIRRYERTYANKT